MHKEISKVFKQFKKSIISEVREKKHGLVNPVIVTFQNGELNENHCKKFNVLLKPTESEETAVEVETPYGHVFKDAHCYKTKKPTQVIAIRNRKTNKVKLVEVDSCVLINSALVSAPSESKVVPEPKNNAKALNTSFGGKKVMSRLAEREKFSAKSMLMADDVKESIEAIKVEGLETSFSETNSIINLLPPCHRDATSLSHVYQLNEIFTQEELDALQKEVLSKESFDSKHYSEFFISCYEDVKKTSDNVDQRLAAILFIEVLIKFLKTPAKKLSIKNSSMCLFSDVIHFKILNEFCMKSENSITRPVTMRDKCLFYMMALCLTCCDYKINLKLLATSVSVPLTRLTNLARLVGAVPVSKDSHLYVLKLPLPAIPKSSKARLKRK